MTIFASLWEEVKKVNSRCLSSQWKMSVARPFNRMTGFITMESLMQMGGVSL